MISFFPLYTEEKIVLRNEIEGVYETKNKKTAYYILGKNSLDGGLKDTIVSPDGTLPWNSGLKLPADISLFLTELNNGPGNNSKKEYIPEVHEGIQGYLIVEDDQPDAIPLENLDDDESQKCAFFERYSFKLMVLTELDGLLYADFEAQNFDIDFASDDDYLSVHTFAQVSLEEDSLMMSFMKEEFLEELFEKNRIRLPHVKREGDGKILLTATSEELQKFVIKFAQDEKAFDSKSKLTKVQGV